MNWHKRYIGALNIYFKAMKQISSLVNCSETSSKRKVMALKMLLISLEEDLVQAEREVISMQFNMTEDDIQEAMEKFQAGSVKVILFLN